MSTVMLGVFVFGMNIVVMLVALSRQDTPLTFVAMAAVVISFVAVIRALRDLPPE